MLERTWRVGLIVQLLLSYLLASALAVGLTLILVQMEIKLPIVLIVAVAAGGVSGLVMTLNIQHSLDVMKLVLCQLLQGRPVKSLSPHWRWPLTTLFMQLQELEQYLAEQRRTARFTAEQRDQLLQQVSEAAVQEERNRLARELHDSIKQQLFSISVSAAALRARWVENLHSATTSLDDIQRSAQEAQVEMQALLQQLRPLALNMAELVEALHTQCQAVGYRTDAQISFEAVHLPLDEQLPPGTPETLFRIAQEALANIARHARARHVWLRLYQHEHCLLLQIRDNGQGFDSTTVYEGMGLNNMRERARTLGGGLEIDSQVGSGTTLLARIPLLERTPAEQSQEQRAREIELQQITGKFAHAREIGVFAVQIAGILILLGMPFLVVALSLGVSVYEFLSANRLSTRLALLIGRDNRQTLSLRYQEQELLSAIFLIAGLCAWYLPVVTQAWPVQINAWLATSLSSLAGALALLTLAQFYRHRNSYYSRLAVQERNHEIKHRQTSARISLGLWLCAAILAYFISDFSFGLPAHSFVQWSSDAGLAILTFWPILDLIDLLWLSLRKQTVDRKEVPHEG